ncbi:MAG: type II toxin-antitoxin system HicB family antitoxin [Capsulimonadaceae bacterium]
MENTIELTIEIVKEELSTGEPVYVAAFREIDVASQGDTVEEARDNAIEAFELLVDTASESELERILPLPRPQSTAVFTARVEFPYGNAHAFVGV